jgi:hypothetical protein
MLPKPWKVVSENKAEACLTEQLFILFTAVVSALTAEDHIMRP